MPIILHLRRQCLRLRFSMFADTARITNVRIIIIISIIYIHLLLTYCTKMPSVFICHDLHSTTEFLQFTFQLVIIEASYKNTNDNVKRQAKYVTQNATLSNSIYMSYVFFQQGFAFLGSHDCSCGKISV